jgi:hypothetical protein
MGSIRPTHRDHHLPDLGPLFDKIAAEMSSKRTESMLNRKRVGRCPPFPLENEDLPAWMSRQEATMPTIPSLWCQPWLTVARDCLPIDLTGQNTLDHGLAMRFNASDADGVHGNTMEQQHEQLGQKSLLIQAGTTPGGDSARLCVRQVRSIEILSRQDPRIDTLRDMYAPGVSNIGLCPQHWPTDCHCLVCTAHVPVQAHSSHGGGDQWERARRKQCLSREHCGTAPQDTSCPCHEMPGQHRASLGLTSEHVCDLEGVTSP